MNQISRRRLLGASGIALLGAGGLSLAGCGDNGGDSTSPGESKRLLFTWWGSTDRQERTNQAIAAFKKANTGYQINPQPLTWDTYWTKLATQVAGGSPPDVIQMDFGYITEYVARNALLPLDEFVPKSIKIDDWSADSLAGGKLDGKLYGVTAGLNSMAMIVNTTVLENAGLEVPSDDISWEDFATLTKQLAAKLPDGSFGTHNGGLSSVLFEAWVRQRGKNFYQDGKLGFDEADLTEYWEYWQDLQKAGAATTPEIEAENAGDMANSLIANNKAAFTFAWSNQLNAFAKASKGEMDIRMYPGGAAVKPGQYYKSSMMFSISAKSKNKDAAAAFINSLVTKGAVAEKLGSERGVPPSPGLRAQIEANASPQDKRIFEYIAAIKDKIGATPQPPPKGAAEIDDRIFPERAEEVAYGKASIQQGVQKFFDEAPKALGG